VEDRNRRLLRARDAMDRAYAEPLDVRAVAAVAYLSEAHFSRSFRAVFGETPNRYLQRRRVERARQMVLQSHLPLKEIVCTTGFYDQSHMTKAFKRTFDATPTELRRMAGPH